MNPGREWGCGQPPSPRASALPCLMATVTSPSLPGHQTEAILTPPQQAPRDTERTVAGAPLSSPSTRGSRPSTQTHLPWHLACPLWGRRAGSQSPRGGRIPDALASAPVTQEAGRQQGPEPGGPVPTGPATALACPASWSRRLTDDLSSLTPWSEARPRRPSQNLHALVGPAFRTRHTLELLKPGGPGAWLPPVSPYHVSQSHNPRPASVAQGLSVDL